MITARGSRFLVLFMIVLAAVVGPAMAKEQIRMVTYGSSFDAYRQIEKAFNEAHPDYELVIEPYVFAEYISKLTVMIASGAPPDVFQTWAQYKPSWVRDGLLMPLDSYWENSAVAREADLYPFIMETAIEDGKIYGVPHDFNAQAWVVDVDAFDRAGIGIPTDAWTVDDVVANAMKLNDPENGQYGVQLSGHWSTSNWQWAVLYNGQGWLNADRSRVLVDEPANIEMLEWWYDLVYSRGVAPSPNEPPALDHWQGGYAMWQGWTGWAFDLGQTAPYDWQLVTLPRGPAGQDAFAQGHMWSIASNAPDPDKSWILLEWLLSDEGQRAIVAYDNRQPMTADSDLWGLYFSRLPQDKQHEVRHFVMDVLYGQDLIHSMSYWPTWSAADTIMNQELNTIFYQNDAPAAAMGRAAQRLRALIGE